ncbi:MAG: hypothetical protein JO250_22745 [Armatimonadetes bacterium]|nr:hypothetical protein [Armatimonadota bacterium]
MPQQEQTDQNIPAEERRVTPQEQAQGDRSRRRAGEPADYTALYMIAILGGLAALLGVFIWTGGGAQPRRYFAYPQPATAPFVHAWAGPPVQVQVVGPAIVIPQPVYGIHRMPVTATTSPMPLHAPDREFRRKLALSRGPHPAYHVVVCPIPGLVGGDGDIDWPHMRAYRLRDIPDGYTVHEGLTPHMAPYTEAEEPSYRVTFAPVGERLVGDWAFTRHHGIHYLRGRIARSDIPNLLQHHTFRVFTDYPLTPQMDSIAGPQGLADVTISLAQTWAQHSTGEQPDGKTFLLRFPEGQHLALDKHAWEEW